MEDYREEMEKNYMDKLNKLRDRYFIIFYRKLF